MKNVKPRHRAGKAKFNAARAVRMYKAGSKVVDIAVAMGYARGQGQNRVRAALIAAGVYSAARAGRSAAAQQSRPASTPEVALNECYKVVESRYKALAPRSKHGWPERLIAMIKNGIGAKKAAVA